LSIKTKKNCENRLNCNSREVSPNFRKYIIIYNIYLDNNQIIFYAIYQILILNIHRINQIKIKNIIDDINISIYVYVFFYFNIIMYMQQAQLYMQHVQILSMQ